MGCTGLPPFSDFVPVLFFLGKRNHSLGSCTFSQQLSMSSENRKSEEALVFALDGRVDGMIKRRDGRGLRKDKHTRC